MRSAEQYKGENDRYLEEAVRKLRAQIEKVLEANESRCLDDEADRLALLVEALMEELEA